jgi:SAM-dependent methyltransferase
LAGEWHTRDVPGRDAALVDALERGSVQGRRCLELGSGIGITSGPLIERFPTVVAADLSMEMLRRSPERPPRMRADGSRLPLADGEVDVLVLMNMLLFPDEAVRILAADGALVWVNSRGTGTPIHLPAADVLAALPGDWSGVASTSGEATWCVARRSS